jgi:hypothetical protein
MDWPLEDVRLVMSAWLVLPAYVQISLPLAGFRPRPTAYAAATVLSEPIPDRQPKPSALVAT